VAGLTKLANMAPDVLAELPGLLVQVLKTVNELIEDGLPKVGEAFRTFGYLALGGLSIVETLVKTILLVLQPLLFLMRVGFEALNKVLQALKDTVRGILEALGLEQMALQWDIATQSVDVFTTALEDAQDAAWHLFNTPLPLGKAKEAVDDIADAMQKTPDTWAELPREYESPREGPSAEERMKRMQQQARNLERRIRELQKQDPINREALEWAERDYRRLQERMDALREQPFDEEAVKRIGDSIRIKGPKPEEWMKEFQPKEPFPWPWDSMSAAPTASPAAALGTPNGYGATLVFHVNDLNEVGRVSQQVVDKNVRREQFSERVRGRNPRMA